MVAETWTRAEVSRRRRDDGRPVFVIDNVVYDVGAFLDEHPGGHEVLMDQVGGDASEPFHDVGHSSDAKELMQKFAVGEIVEAERVELKRHTVPWDEPKVDADEGRFIMSWKFPVVLGVLLTVLYTYLLG